MTKVILTSLLIFLVETILHSLIIIISLVMDQESDLDERILYGLGYFKLKLIFYLLPYLICHTYFLRNKRFGNLWTHGLIQVALFLCLTFITFPISGMLIDRFLTALLVALFLLVCWITPFLVLNLLPRKYIAKP